MRTDHDLCHPAPGAAVRTLRDRGDFLNQIAGESSRLVLFPGDGPRPVRSGRATDRRLLRPMIRITTQIYRGFAINIQQVDEASPPFWATIRRRFRQTHTGPRVFKGETEEGVVSQACAAVD